MHNELFMERKGFPAGRKEILGERKGFPDGREELLTKRVFRGSQRVSRGAKKSSKYERRKQMRSTAGR